MSLLGFGSVQQAGSTLLSSILHLKMLSYTTTTPYIVQTLVEIVREKPSAALVEMGLTMISS